ncbi:hypothetical protein GSI_03268 [Ganoderma sinense ZZ0214-1]|uniref:Uncharacterized protein n=1 Tax=Ganoderma sinense ZZ0214-1 TaxID=1077348 RepID=A0A2G8SL57_9APHY|nr:hypothetical protein GSI_03268 [Ganoderma sinense ZZ0214-1]
MDEGRRFPDDESVKLIELQAAGLYPPVAGDRHVLLRWFNGMEGSHTYTQVIHLTGGPGNYAFLTPSIKRHSEESRRLNTFYPLGLYTRAQRDQIISLASSIRFNRRSTVNDCLVWMRDLLEAMVAVGLLHKATFDVLDAQIPLKKRVRESSDGVPSAN